MHSHMVFRAKGVATRDACMEIKEINGEVISFLQLAG